MISRFGNYVECKYSIRPDRIGKLMLYKSKMALISIQIIKKQPVLCIGYTMMVAVQ
jgi:hypothetical protein